MSPILSPIMSPIMAPIRIALRILIALSALTPHDALAQESQTQARRADLSERIADDEDEPTLLDSLVERTTLGLGFDYNRGDFESDQSTDTGSLTAMIKLDWEIFSVRAALPFYGVEGPGNADLQGSNGTDYGVGDLVTSVTYTLFPARDYLPFFDFILKLKLPTANSNFGTEKTDVTLLVDAIHSFDPLVVFADFGYRFRGGGEYRDTLLAAVGGGIQFPIGSSLWLAYDWRESPFRERGDEHELTPFLSIPVGDHLRIDPYVVIGLAQASPDWGVGSTLSWKF
jgi:hypothetical protein